MSQLATREAQNLVRKMITRKGTEGWMDDEDYIYEAAEALGVPDEEVTEETINHLRDLVGEAVVVVRFPNTRTRRTHR